MKRRATAIWKGTGKDGSGTLSGPSKVLNETPYSAALRFANEDGKAGTNPEELIAAAHAGCFNMALSFALANAGHEAEELHTRATITIEKGDDGFAFTQIVLDLKGKVPGMEEDEFVNLAQGAKVGCPVSKALSSVPMDLNIEFNS